MLNKFRALRRLLIEWKYGHHNAKLARLQSENDWHSHIKPFPWQPLVAMGLVCISGLVGFLGIIYLGIITWPESIIVVGVMIGVFMVGALFLWTIDVLGDL